jgi:hypothetical protein
MKEEMTRGRSQVIWRYAPGAAFRYNETGGWCLTSSITLSNPTPLTGALANAVALALRRWKAVGITGYPDPNISPNKYAVGEPYQVSYSIWPTVFTCRRCGRVHFYKDIDKLRQVNDRLSCSNCKDRDLLRQVPYAYVCECGRIDSVFISSQGHHSHHIELVDRGSFQESYWYCKTCGIPLYRNAKEGLGFRACQCVPRKAKRGILLEDSRVYYTQSINLVDIEPKALEPWQDNKRFSDLLLAAVLRVPTYSPRHLHDLARWKPTGPELSPELKAMRAILLERGMNDTEVDAMLHASAKHAGADPWNTYDSDLAQIRDLADAREWKESRQTVEYVFVRDEPSATAISLDQLIKEADSRVDLDSAERLRDERQLASQLGLVNLQIVQSLPILLAGIGYTRYYGSPRDTDDDGGSSATLQPYVLQEGKIPIYVARNTTEALMYELDPWRLTAFLSVNMGSAIPDKAVLSGRHLAAWLLGQNRRLVETGESHLILRSFEEEEGVTVDETSALVFGVLHTISHVLKATAHRYVGIDADSLAEYLFPAHVAGLLYASTHVEFTLGGIDSVFRSNLTQWLGSARDYAANCSFDPVCSQSGGACLACLYPKFGCGYFNRTVSRSFLFGGKVPGYATELQGFWSSAVGVEAKRLRAKQSL